MLGIKPLGLEAFWLLLHLFLKELRMVDGVHVVGLEEINSCFDALRVKVFPSIRTPKNILNMILILHIEHSSSEHVSISQGCSLGDVVEIECRLTSLLVKHVFLRTLFTDLVDEHVNELYDFLVFLFTFIGQ